MSEHWGTKTISSIDTKSLWDVVKPLIPYPTIASGITGSHMWGLATDDSDIDIRGIYAWPLQKHLHIEPGRDTIEQVGIGPSCNIDFQLYELKKACRMLASNNGNLVELLLSPTQIIMTETEQTLKKIVKQQYVTKQLSKYYRGYATSQRKRAAQNRGGKALIYSFRELYSGIYLMKNKQIIYNFRTLCQLIEKEDIFTSKLLPIIFDRPKWKIVDAIEMQQFDSEWKDLCRLLEIYTIASELPEAPPKDHATLQNWLWDTVNQYDF